jgi:hypothetical protein
MSLLRLFALLDSFYVGITKRIIFILYRHYTKKILGYLLFISGNKPRKKKRSRKIVLLSLMEVASFFRPVFLRAEKR